MVHPLGLRKRARLAERQIVGVGAVQREAQQPRGRRRAQPFHHVAAEPLRQRGGDGAAAVGRVGEKREQFGPGIAERARGIAQIGGQRRLELLAQCRRQPGRHTARAHRHQHRIARHDRGQGEVAQVRAVDGVDEHAARTQARDDGFGIVRGDDGERSSCILADDHGTGAHQQPALGFRRFAGADQHDRPPRQLHEDRQGGERHFSSQSGICSAPMIVSAVIRPATVSKRSPETSTSGTSARLL